jgi:hypothetical protein
MRRKARRWMMKRFRLLPMAVRTHSRYERCQWITVYLGHRTLRFPPGRARPHSDRTWTLDVSGLRPFTWGAWALMISKLPPKVTTR